MIFLPSKFAFITGFDSYEFVFIPRGCDKVLRATLLPVSCYVKPLFFFGDVPTYVSKNSPDVFYWLKAVGRVFSLVHSCVRIQARPSHHPNWRNNSLHSHMS